MFDWRWDFTYEILPRLLVATLNTLMAAGLGYAIALVLGLVLALAQRTPSRLLIWAVREAVEFIRPTPLVLQIFFVFYVFPQFGIGQFCRSGIDQAVRPAVIVGEHAKVVAH